jgi:hypothetical protein
MTGSPISALRLTIGDVELLDFAANQVSELGLESLAWLGYEEQQQAVQCLSIPVFSTVHEHRIELALLDFSALHNFYEVFSGIRGDVSRVGGLQAS